MPDVKIRAPHDIFDNIIEYRRDDSRILFVTAMSGVVAHALSCLDYDNEPMELAPEHIDVHLMTYEDRDVHMHGAPVLIEISGYDYPSRMPDMTDRLSEVQAAATRYLTNVAHFKHEGKMVSVSYIPIPNGCWV